MRNSRLDTDSARGNADCVEGLWRPLAGPSIDFREGGLGMAMVGVGVEPRLEEPPPVLGGKAGGVSGSVSFRISLSSAYLSARGGGAKIGDVTEVIEGAGDETPLDTGDIGRLKGDSLPVVLPDIFLGLSLFPKVRFKPSRSTELGLLLSC